MLLLLLLLFLLLNFVVVVVFASVAVDAVDAGGHVLGRTRSLLRRTSAFRYLHAPAYMIVYAVR